MLYAVVDLETTGSRPLLDKIIDIAIIVHDGKRELKRFSSLVNPETHIPPAISRLTGITGDMVSQAPRFFEIAQKVVELTEGCVFVAHNVQFDYSFLKAAFQELGYRYRRPTLCTLRLSRLLMPELPKHGLSALSELLGVPNRARHRALGDAEVTARLLEQLLQISDVQAKQAIVQEEIQAVSLPPYIDRRQIENLPEDVGVYFLKGENGETLYVGKSRNIYRRVLQHFQVSEKQRRRLRLKEKVHAVEYRLTGSELVALLLENHLIKQIKPPFNRAQRHKHFQAVLAVEMAEDGYLHLSIQKTEKLRGNPLYFFPSIAKGRELLYQLVKKHELCMKLAHLYDTRHACFDYQVGLCKGACVGAEAAESYNQRVRQAFKHLPGIEHGNMLIVERGRHSREQAFVLVENSQYRGFGYAPAGLPEAELLAQRHEFLQKYPDYKDHHHIIRSYLKKHPHTRILYF
ncbi:exonuclease domain-containing protein [Thermonema rossianum]|uniref:exonuclease domain-containing protein n=1 Tax=Thermonema rossianum TaxID=55505 RepID=UPI0005718086|nr:exonuclease domain-containing protein [Thermonema rossianum]